MFHSLLSSLQRHPMVWATGVVLFVAVIALNRYAPDFDDDDDPWGQM